MQVWSHYPNFDTLERDFSDIKAVLWDMDGTILNTEKIHFESIMALIATHNNIEEFQLYCHGKTDAEVLSKMLAEKLCSQMNIEQFIQLKEDQFRALIETKTVDHILAPEVRETIKSFKNKNIKQAIVTSSEKITTDFLLEKAKIKQEFNFIITREDTIENKPSPMPYQFAMEKLNVTPEQVLIFEDSEVGYQAAVTSGASVIKAHWYL